MPKVIIDDKKGLFQESGVGFLTGQGPLVLGHEKLSGAGAIDPNIPLTLITSTGAAEAVTLADADSIGAVKHIVHQVDGGSTVITVASSLGDANTITLTAVGETVSLVWSGSAWALINRGAFVDAGAAAVAGLAELSTV